MPDCPPRSRHCLRLGVNDLIRPPTLSGSVDSYGQGRADRIQVDEGHQCPHS